MSFSLKSNLIGKLYKNKWHDKLIKIITKSLSKTIKKEDIIAILDAEYDDKKIIEKLTELVQITTTPYSEENNIKRALNKWRNIKPQINFKINGMMDYGGGVGDAAFAMGQVLHLPKNKILVVDVDEFGGVKYKPRSDVSFFHFDNINDINTTVDLITVNHVLHHIKAKEYPKILALFDRILNKNGIIVLYEHDCGNKNMANIINLEHMIYDVCGTKKMTYAKFVKEFYAKYLTVEQWQKIFSSHFEIKHIIRLNNADNSTYIFFKRATT